MSSFLVSKEDVKNFFNVPRLNMQQGICFAVSYTHLVRLPGLH